MRQININSLFLLFGINIQVWMNNCQNFLEAQKRFDEAKVETKKRFKDMAFELHPDRNPGHEDEFKQLANARDFIEQLNVQPPQPVMRVFVNLGGFTNTSTTTNTSYTSTC